MDIVFWIFAAVYTAVALYVVVGVLAVVLLVGLCRSESAGLRTAPRAGRVLLPARPAVSRRGRCELHTRTGCVRTRPGVAPHGAGTGDLPGGGR